MLITKYIEIDMGHRVPNHKSKCRNLHGHRYKIEVGVDDKIITSSGTSDEGMVIDFGDLKKIMMDEIDAKFDHGFVVYEADELVDMFAHLYHGNKFSSNETEFAKIEKSSGNQKIIFVPFIPTAENLAKHWYELIESKLKEKGIKIKFVRVFETPTSTATYEK